MAITLTQTKDEVLVVHDARRRHGLDFASKEKRLWISISKRLQHFVPTQKLDIDVRKCQLVVQAQRRLQRFFGKKLACDGAKCFGKAMKIFLAHCESGCHFVSAVFVEAVSAMSQRRDHVQSFDASSASLADSVLVETDHNCWSMIFSDNSRRHDAKHPWMPRAAAGNDGRITSSVGVSLDLLYRCIKDLVFHVLPFPIVLIEFCRERRCFAFVMCKQEPQGFFRRAQTPCSVQPRAEPVTDVVWQDRRVDSGNLH